MKALRCAALALAVVGLSAQGAETTNAWWEVDFTSPTPVAPEGEAWPQGYGGVNLPVDEGTLGALTNNFFQNGAQQPYLAGHWTMIDGDESYITNSFNATNTWTAFGFDECIKLDTQGNDLTWTVETNELNNHIMEEGRKALVDADLYLVGSDSEPTEFDTGDVQTAIYLKNETDDGEGGTGETTNSVLCVYIFDPLLGNSGENTWRELDGVELKDNSWAHVQVIVDHSDDDNNPPTVQVFVNGTPMHARGGDATSWTAANGSDSQSAGRVSSVSFRGTGAVDNFVGQTVKKTVEKFDFVAEVFMDNTLVPQGQAGNVSRTELAVPVGPTEHADFLGFSFHDYEQDVKDATFVLKRIEFINQGNGEVTAIDYSYQNHQMLPTNSPAVFFEKEDITETDEETGDDIVVGERQTGTFNVLAPTAGATSNSVIARIYFQTFGANNAQAVTDLAGVVTTNETLLLPATAGGIYPTNLVWTFDAVKGDNILTNLVLSNGATFDGYANGKATVKVTVADELDADTLYAAASYVAGALADGQDLRPTTNGNEIIFAPYVPPVAMIGTTGYPSLRAAIAAAQDGDTIVMVADDRVSFTAENPEVVINKALTIDGGSNTLYGVTNHDSSTAGDHDLFINPQAGNVTIKNLTFSEFSDSVPFVLQRTYPIWTSQAYAGMLTLDGVTIEKYARTAVNINNGLFLITNCVIRGRADDATKPAEWYQAGITTKFGQGDVYDTVITGIGADVGKWDSACFTLGVEGTGRITVHSGDYTGDFVASINSNATGRIELQGGTFVATNVDGEEDEDPPSAFITSATVDTIVISGGWFDREPAAKFLAAGYVADEAAPGTDTPWTVILGNAIWIGGAQGDWEDAANWDIGLVPTKDTVVTITNDAEVVILSKSDACKEMVLRNANVTLVRDANATEPTLHIYGNAGRAVSVDTGATGSLGVNNLALFTERPDGDLTIGCDLQVLGSVTFRGLSIVSSQLSSSFVITGKTTISADALVKTIDYGTTKFQGGIEVAKGVTAKITTNPHGGAQIATGVTLVANDGTGNPTAIWLMAGNWDAELVSGASVAVDAAHAETFYVKKGSEKESGTTCNVYTATPKRTVVSVAADEGLTVEGIATGDRFVPGTNFVIAVTGVGDGYEPSVMITNATDILLTTNVASFTYTAPDSDIYVVATKKAKVVEPPQVDAGTGLEEYKADPAHAGETVPEPFEFVEVDNTNKAQIAFVAPEAGTYVLYSCTTVDGQYEEDSGSAKLVDKGALVKLVETTPATTGAKFFKIYWTAP